MADNFFDPNSPDDDSEGLTLTPQPDGHGGAPDSYESISALITNASGGGALDENENSLETKFEDPQMLQELVNNEAGATSLVEETAEAVHELILDPSAEVGGESYASPLSDEPLIPLPVSSPEMTTAPAAEFIPDAGAAATTPRIDANSDLINADQGDLDSLGSKVQLYQDTYGLILSEHPFDILVEKTLQAAMRAVNAQAGSILEFDYEKSEYFFRASRGGASDKVKTFRIPQKQGIVGYIGESQETLLINEMEDDKLQLKAVSVAVGFEAHSCLATPIVIANKLYGVLEVFNKMGTLYFTETDKALVQEAARAVAKVLEVRFFVAEIMRRGKE